jgi:hypothetical protein
MTSPLQQQGIAQRVAALAERVREIETARRGHALERVSSGSPQLDRLLAGGFQRGSLVEWLADSPASGAGTLALVAGREAACQGGAIVVIDRERTFYPPAAAALGVDLARLMIVRPQNEADHAWALDQILRSRGVAAVWCRVPRADDHAWRRWQLAAETTGALGLFVRELAARDEPSWSEWRLGVRPIVDRACEGVGRSREVADRARHVSVEVLRMRGGRAGGATEIQLPENPAAERPADPRSGSTNHEARAMHLAAPVGPAKAGRRSRRA